MVLRVPNDPMHIPHKGEHIHTIVGMERLDASNKAMDRPENEISIEVRAVIFSAIKPKIIFPAIPDEASRLNAMVDLVRLIPSFT